MRKALRFLLVATVGVAGCEEATGPVATEYLGTYQLESFNGAMLPYVSAVDAGIRVEVLRGAITLDSDFGYTMDRSWRLTYTDSVRNHSSDLEGDYAIRGNQIMFFGGPSKSRFGGIVTDSVLTIVEEETLINFRRSN